MRNFAMTLKAGLLMVFFLVFSAGKVDGQCSFTTPIADANCVYSVSQLGPTFCLIGSYEWYDMTNGVVISTNASTTVPSGVLVRVSLYDLGGILLNQQYFSGTCIAVSTSACDSISLQVHETPTNCGDSMGILMIEVNGDPITATHQYAWSTGDTTTSYTLGSLAAGTYSVTVTTTDGGDVCIDSTTYTLGDTCNQCTFTPAYGVVHDDCHLGSGKIVTTDSAATNAGLAFTFRDSSWNVVVGTSGNAFNLYPGTYYAIATDGVCFDTTTIVINGRTNPFTYTQTFVNGGATCYTDTVNLAMTVIDPLLEGFPYNWIFGSSALSTSISPDSLSASATFLATSNPFIGAIGVDGCGATPGLPSLDPPGLSTVVTDACPGTSGGGFIIQQILNADDSSTLTFSGPSNNSFNAALGDTIMGLLPGTYHVTIVDPSGCTGYDSVIVGSITQMSLAYTFDTATCSNSNGAINVAGITGGNAPYTQVWGGQHAFVTTPDSLGSLYSGNYWYTISDVNGCMITDTINVPSVGDIDVDINDSEVYCDGTILLNIEVETGIADSVVWTHVPTGQLFFGDTVEHAPAGLYNIEIYSPEGCLDTETWNAQLDNQINCINCDSVIVTAIVTHDTCGDMIGEIDLAVSYSQPYDSISYSWFNGYAGNEVTGLGIGTYSVTVTLWYQAQSCVKVLDSIVVGGKPNDWYHGYFISMPVCDTEIGIGGIIITDQTGGPVTWSFPGGPYVDSTTTNFTATVSFKDTITAIIQGVDTLGCNIFWGFISSPPPCPIAISIDSVKADWCGDSSGYIIPSITGGAYPYSFVWVNLLGDTVSTDSIATNLPSGTYNLHIVDVNGSIEQATTIVDGNPPLTLLIRPTHASCNEDNGLVGLTTTGGSGDFTSLWSDGVTNGARDSLAAGSYYLTITDDNGCVMSDSVIILQLGKPAVHVDTVGDYSCLSGGFIDITTAGGVLPYSYSWNNGDTTENISGLAAGYYSVTVTDSLNCYNTLDSIIVMSTQLSAVATAIRTRCGEDNGIITVNTTGGAGPYTYNWSNGATTDTLTGLAPGAYYLTVTDANGCTDNAYAIVLASSPAILQTSIIATDTCGFGTGVAFADLNIGVATYQWSNGDTSFQIWYGGNFVSLADSLTAGTYTVIGTDHYGCSDTATVVVPGRPNPVWIKVDTLVTGTCGDPSQYLITYDTYLSPLVEIDADSGSFVVLSNVNDSITVSLTSGELDISVMDPTGCWAELDINYGVEGVVITLDTILPERCEVNPNNGEIHIVISGGSGSYSFEWKDASGNIISTDSVVTGLDGGIAWNPPSIEYTVVVTDSITGCIAVDTFLVSHIGGLYSIYVQKSNAYCGELGDVYVDGNPNSVGRLIYEWSDVNGNIIQIDTTPAGGGPSWVYDVPAGWYYLFASDESGCTFSDSIQVVGSTPVVASLVTAVDDVCADSTGVIQITASGGTPAYTYQLRDAIGGGFIWQNGNGSGNFLVTAGSYHVIVYDVNACRDTILVTIGQGVPVATTVTVDAQNHCGDGSGQATVSAVGGSGSYTYVWENSQATATAIGLATDTYTVTVTDGNGCTTTDYAVIVGRLTPFQIDTLLLASPTCHDDSAYAFVGTGLYGGDPIWNYSGNYLVSSSPLANQRGLDFWGNITVTATDTFGCSATSTFSYSNPDSIKVTLWTKGPAKCGWVHGFANFHLVDSVGTYTVELYQGANQLSTIFYSVGSGGQPGLIQCHGLNGGNHTLRVINQDGCIKDVDFFIFSSVMPTITLDSVANDNCSMGLGYARVSVTGTGPLTINWTRAGVVVQSGSSNELFNIVGPASHPAIGFLSAQVVDPYGCSVSVPVPIANPCNTSTQSIEALKGKVYPNPFQESFIFGLDQNSGNDGVWVMYNSVGQEVESGSVNGKTTTIDSAGLPAGVYIFRAVVDEKTFTTRVVKY